MNENLSVEVALKRNKYSFIYNIGFLIIIINIVCMYLFNTIKYSDYCYLTGKFVNNNFLIEASLKDINYLKKTNIIIIDGIGYNYEIIDVDNYILKNNKCYYTYLNVYNLNRIENHAYQVKILKERMTLVKYLKKFFGGNK